MYVPNTIFFQKYFIVYLNFKFNWAFYVAVLQDLYHLKVRQERYCFLDHSQDRSWELIPTVVLVRGLFQFLAIGHPHRALHSTAAGFYQTK